MYRYTIDNAVTYTSEDFVLFRESPFACWMERLNLENPDHGIPPDIGSVPPSDSIERQDDMADTLRAEGKDVRLIDWDADEPSRRSATLDAMRRGTDFIVNGQLALGPLSGAANLLVRTSGYSELGDFLYIPCETQARSTLHSAFRLCFLADLLHSLQGQLPPQMLIIRGGDDLVPMQTESHIYHYRAVKQRFMEAMRGFRKHRMPDPAESSHFGRWSDCAHEVLKQRLLREEHELEDSPGDDYVEPLRKAVGSAVGGGAGSAYDLDDIKQQDGVAAGATTTALAGPGADAGAASPGNLAPAAMTLAEQARMLKPGTYKPGPGVYRLGRPRVTPTVRPEALEDRAAEESTPPGDIPPTETPKYNRRASDAALQNLEFIGSKVPAPGASLAAPTLAELSSVASTAPPPNLRGPRTSASFRQGPDAASGPDPVLGNTGLWHSPVLTGTGQEQESVSPLPAADPVRPLERERSTIDMDGTHMATPPPGLTTSSAVLPAEFPFADERVEHGFGQAGAGDRRQRVPSVDSRFNDRLVTEGSRDHGGFSNSLITSDDYRD